MSAKKKAMRDVFIRSICDRMYEDNGIFFLSGDFGSPELDRLREEFSDRFVNVGIAEQNLINVATGLALEGYTVYAYAIAGFITMRCYEQVRINLSLHAQLKEINVNLIGVGAGISYDVSGPSHHCLEDLSIMRTLPNIEVFSPSDWFSVENFVDYSITVKKPKYFRLDSKPVSNIVGSSSSIEVGDCFRELIEGDKVCLVSTGFMTHRAMEAADILKQRGIKVGVVDVFRLKPFNETLFHEKIGRYDSLVTLEEAFVNKGGLDSLVANVLREKDSNALLINIGFSDSFVFELGGREHLHRLNGMDGDSIAKRVEDVL